jgi:serine/threonine protein phosphatase PrpC
MTGELQTDFWQVVGRSVCGASHRRRRAANQDALEWSRAGSTAVVVAVADGHGSAACFRSGEGAALAVQCAGGLLRNFFEQWPEYEEAALAAREIPDEMVALWREAVARHLADTPFTRAERKSLDGREEAQQWRVYGSTVLGVLATPSYVLYLQLGDGDILIVSESGGAARPWPRDPRLLGLETTSLCGEHAAAETRVAVQAHCGMSPALVVLSTDGYANSFREDEGFLRTGGDLLEVIREDGLEGVERNLETWLNEASELGSGDDITVAVVSRTAAGVGDGH